MNPSTRGGPHPGAGRKSDTYQADYAHIAHQAMLLGATDANLAAFFRVSERTINRWKKHHAEFAKAIHDGKLIADAKVARTLYKRAMGYSHTETQVLCCQGKIINTEIVKHHPPDVTACILWLCNRQPDLWKYPGPINTDEPVTEEPPPQHVPSSSG